MALVTAYRKDTGQRVQIPEHWLGHKRLGKPFRKTPPAEKSRGTEKAPAASGGDANTPKEN